jgi:hypothetical protein
LIPMLAIAPGRATAVLNGDPREGGFTPEIFS